MSFQVRDPVHNFIALREYEVKLLGTKALQRLRGIHQLALANLVYPGAVHTRFDHSLGVTHVAGLMAEQLGLEEGEKKLVRLAALLHDVGHGPFSHVSEHVLALYANLEPGQKSDRIHELITAKIIQEDDEIRKILGESTCRDITALLTEGHGQPALRSIVSGPLDADKQDYLLRDSYFCGVQYGVFDIQQFHRSLTLRGSEDEKELMIKYDGIHAVEQYVLAKYYLTTNVYRHKVRLITDQMIIRAITLGIEQDDIAELKELYRFDNSAEFAKAYMNWDDARFMHEFCITAKSSLCKELLDRLRRRKLLKRVYEAKSWDFSAKIRNVLFNSPKPDFKKLRTKLEYEIAKKLEKVIGEPIEKHFVIVHSFDIRSVREMSRNDETEILVVKKASNSRPQAFDKASTLFKSISERYADSFVEVYAPVEWGDRTQRAQIYKKLQKLIKAIIEDTCKNNLGGAA